MVELILLVIACGIIWIGFILRKLDRDLRSFEPYMRSIAHNYVGYLLHKYGDKQSKDYEFEVPPRSS